jgi:MFS family permease
VPPLPRPGVFTDAYDLFVIGIASTLITKDWNLSSGRLALLNSTMLFAAFLGAGARTFRDVSGRKRVYWLGRGNHGGGRAGVGAVAVVLGC